MPVAYSEPSQRSKMECLAKVVHAKKLVIIFAKHSILMFDRMKKCKNVQSKSLKFFPLKYLHIFFYATQETINKPIQVIWAFADIALTKKMPGVLRKSNLKYGLSFGKFYRSEKK